MRFLPYLIILFLLGFKTDDTINLYEIPYGSYNQETITAGMMLESKVSFVKYGTFQYTEINSIIFGKRIQSKMLERNDTIYYIEEQKTGKIQRRKDARNYGNLNFDNLNANEKMKMNYKEHGDTLILNCKCKKITINDPEQQLWGAYYVYKGITFLMNVKISNIPLKMRVTSFDEKSTPNLTLFNIPQEIKWH